MAFNFSKPAENAVSPPLTTKPLKRWKSFADQLAQLEARGLIVDDRPAALHDLQHVGYYRLSGYWYPMRAMDTSAAVTRGQPVRCDDFLPGSTFEDVMRLYVFDKKLKLLALDALERIELAVRVTVAHLLGSRDAVAHENPACFHGNFAKKRRVGGANPGRTGHEVWLAKYHSLLKRARKQPFVQHHELRYGKLPIWVAIELWDFGLLSKLLSGMTHADQQAVASGYGFEKGAVFAQCLRSLNFIRNVSAHHGRLWNLNVLERTAWMSGHSVALDNSRLYFYLCLMQKLLEVICPQSEWCARLHDLLQHEFPAPTNGAFTLEDMGAPVNWATDPIWKNPAHK